MKENRTFFISISNIVKIRKIVKKDDRTHMDTVTVYKMHTHDNFHVCLVLFPIKVLAVSARPFFFYIQIITIF